MKWFAAIALLLSFNANADAWLAAQRVAGIDVRDIQAIAIAESGTKWTDKVVRPWPWTINSPVTGPMRFASKAEAVETIHRLLRTGVTNIDIGLMQLNWKYHGHRARDPSALIEPSTNIIVAATYLRELMQKNDGDVVKSIAMYHTGSLADQSRIVRGEKYLDNVAKFSRKLKGI